jgi:hypothetical protein
MRLLPAVWLLTSLLLFGCNVSKKGESNSFNYPATSMIKLSKGACYGTCPIYDLSIYGNGKAVYIGKRFTDLEGEYYRVLTTTATNALFDRFVEADFWSYEDHYTSDIADLPSTWITFEHDDQSKMVLAYYNVPESLLNLIREVESVIESYEWEKGSGQ